MFPARLATTRTSSLLARRPNGAADMSPRAATNDIADTVGSDAVFGGKCVPQFSGRETLPDRDDLLLGDLRTGVPLASSRRIAPAAFLDHVLGVVFCRPGKQVRRSDARRIVTVV